MNNKLTNSQKANYVNSMTPEEQKEQDELQRTAVTTTATLCEQCKIVDELAPSMSYCPEHDYHNPQKESVNMQNKEVV